MRLLLTTLVREPVSYLRMDRELRGAQLSLHKVKASLITSHQFEIVLLFEFYKYVK